MQRLPEQTSRPWEVMNGGAAAVVLNFPPDSQHLSGVGGGKTTRWEEAAEQTESANITHASTETVEQSGRSELLLHLRLQVSSHFVFWSLQFGFWPTPSWFLEPEVTIFGREGGANQTLHYIIRMLILASEKQAGCPSFTKWTSCCIEEDLKLEIKTIKSFGTSLLRE